MKINTRYNFIYFLFLILISAGEFRAQEIFPPANLQFKKHNINEVRYTVTNFGSSLPVYIQSGSPGILLNYPAGSSQELAGHDGVWIGAVVDGDTLVTTFCDYAAYGAVDRDYRYEGFPRFNNNDTIYQKSIYDNISEAASAQYFFNDDGTLDERYNPRSAQDLICEFWDNKIVYGTNQAPDILEDHVPMNARVIQRSFGYDFFLYNKILFIEYIIINEGTKTWNDLYFAQFDGPDIRTNVNVDSWGDDFAVYDKDRRMMYWGDISGGGDGTMLTDLRKAERIIGAPFNVNGNTLKASFRHWVHAEDAPNDMVSYTWMSNNTIQADMSEEIPAGAYVRAMFSLGPYEAVEPGDTVRYVTALIIGDDYEEMIKYADAAKTLYDSGFNVPVSPSPPVVTLTSKKGKTILNWEWKDEYLGTNPEEYEDKSRNDGQINDFEGYRIYRSSEGPDGPWQLLADFDKEDGYGYDTGLKYEFEDEGLINGIRYWYSVTSYDIPEVVSKELTVPSLESSKSLSTSMSIPVITKGDIEEEGVFVVPNPYRGDVDYTQNPAWEYSTQAGRTEWYEIDRRVAFMNLPASGTITIYTIAGYEVKQIDFGGSSGSPIVYWNLLNKNNHAVASGLYYFVVTEPKGKSQIGKFVIVK